MSTPSAVHRLSATINAEKHELRPALSGFLLFFSDRRRPHAGVCGCRSSHRRGTDRVNTRPLGQK
ncbi:hypothetical protein [Stutzerimonas stutzeri]|uniref:hypothetical protein n=1 Tax=Stutzerimonas stutzeri TaxID=316 RepID=UPI00190DF62C|nr:hypothetical protein [Stutzerimonas stutzeri]